jgi:hypothetical protein
VAVDSGVPKESDGSGLPPDPLQGAERAFEEHEGDLMKRIIDLVQRGIAEDATVGEAMIEMRRAMREDPAANELIQRLLAMMLFDGGHVVENWPEWWRENRPLD